MDIITMRYGVSGCQRAGHADALMVEEVTNWQTAVWQPWPYPLPGSSTVAVDMHSGQPFDTG